MTREEEQKNATCPVCNGVGLIELPKHTDKLGMKRVSASALREHGYSIRQIMRFLGYKSPGSVQELLN